MEHDETCGEVCFGRLRDLHMDFSVPRNCGLPKDHKGEHIPDGDDRLTSPRGYGKEDP